MNNKNIWAPWRIEYLKTLAQDNHDSQNQCFLCKYWANPDQDKKNLVLWRTKKCMALFNRFPYTGGHMLVAPAKHLASMHQLDSDTMLEMMTLACDLQTVLNKTICPHGFNVGININHCAGAGLPGHLHLHVVPRWEGDTNFMAVLGQVRVVSQALDDLYQSLVEISTELKLPKIK